MTTVDNHLTALVGSDGMNFSLSQKDEAIDLAVDFLGTTENDTGAKAVATAMLAQRILLNLKKSTDEQSSLSSLMTDDIRSLMAEDEKSKHYKVVHYKKPTVDWRS